MIIDQVHIKIKNGHGIDGLDHIFNFTNSIDHRMTHIVYAQNGTMKSSLTKTLQDHIAGGPIKDHIYDLTGNCSITNDAGDKLPSDDILAISSFDTIGFAVGDVTPLVASEKIKVRYDKLMSNYNDALSDLLSELKQVSKVKSTIKPEDIIGIFCSTFGDNIPKDNFLQLIKTSKPEIDKAPDFFTKISYSVIGEPYVEQFADANKSFLDDFVTKYDEMIEKSAYLRGGFSTGNAQIVSDTLDKQNFFLGEHKVRLFNGEKEEEIATANELRDHLETEFDKIFDDPGIKKKFQTTLKKIDQQNHKDLKNILIDKDTRYIIKYLNNPKLLKRNAWFGYLKACQSKIDALISVDESIKSEIKTIVEEAKSEQTDWDETVRIFKDRFQNLPFTISISNKDSVILKGVDIPSLQYTYEHKIKGRKVFGSESDMLRTLSTGERKAFYLLNLIFELRMRERKGTPQLIILDDVVDSFDYKNKYAFLEYLHELSSQANNLYCIILTHNFDFFRLIQLRFFGHAYRDNSWFAYRNDTTGAIDFEKAGQINPFKATKKLAATDKLAWLSLIPFVRNLIDFNEGDCADYKTLTSCLHRNDGDVSVGEVQAIYSSRIGLPTTPFQNSEKIPDLIFAQADLIIRSSPSSTMNLNNKLILCMAARLKIENYMISKLSTSEVTAAIVTGRNFTRELSNRFGRLSSSTQESKKVIDKVNLITPENIHINAFMYEPLIDMGEDELRKLYEEAKGLS